MSFPDRQNYLESLIMRVEYLELKEEQYQEKEEKLTLTNCSLKNTNELRIETLEKSEKELQTQIKVFEQEREEGKIRV